MLLVMIHTRDHLGGAEEGDGTGRLHESIVCDLGS